MNKRIPSYLLLLPLLFACQTTQAPFPTEVSTGTNLYLDQFFTLPSQFHIESEKEIFQLDQDMIDMVNSKLKNKRTIKKRAAALLNYIFDEDNIALTYDGNANVIAREAFRTGSANCMSLTIMAYALAKEAELDVSFQQINVPEYWVRNGRYNQLTGHVNLLIKGTSIDSQTVVWGGSNFEIDFDPSAVKKSFSKKVISKQTILAMFYNNKGADALVVKNYPLAYLYFKEATKSDSSFSPAWGNLAILYKVNGLEIEAEKVYRHATKLQPDNLNALANLGLLLHRQERIEEAAEINRYIIAIRRKNPYYHAVLADEAFYSGDFNLAEQHYKNAIELDKNEHEFYFGLAKVYYMQQRLTLSKKSMRMAISLNKSVDIDEQYIAKLNVLKKIKSSY